jgi:hypothetical protein
VRTRLPSLTAAGCLSGRVACLDSLLQEEFRAWHAVLRCMAPRALKRESDLGLSTAIEIEECPNAVPRMTNP